MVNVISYEHSRPRFKVWHPCITNGIYVYYIPFFTISRGEEASDPDGWKKIIYISRVQHLARPIPPHI